MRLKNLRQSPHEGFVFYFKHPQNGETWSVGQVNSLEDLVSKVELQFRNLKMEVPENLRQLVEHQICLRQPNPSEACWSGGLGDDLHHKWIKPFLSKVADTLDPKFPDRDTRSAKRSFISRAARAVAKTARRVSSCSSCGGTRVYDQGSNNLGRAGNINQVIGPTNR